MREILIPVFSYIEQHKAVGSIIYVIFFGILSLLLVPTTFPTIVAGVIFKPLPLAVMISLLGSQVVKI